jgi:DNA helicase TIP49 (TBP-interacting protein)
MAPRVVLLSWFGNTIVTSEVGEEEVEHVAVEVCVVDEEEGKVAEVGEASAAAEEEEEEEEEEEATAMPAAATEALDRCTVTLSPW